MPVRNRKMCLRPIGGSEAISPSGPCAFALAPALALLRRFPGRLGPQCLRKTRRDARFCAADSYHRMPHSFRKGK